MTIGGAATLLGMVAEPLGRVVGWVVWVFLTYTIEVVRLTADLPVGVWRGELPNWAPWAYYGTLALTTWWCVTPAERRREVLGRVWRWITAHVETKMLFGGSGILLVLAFFAWKELPDGRLHVHFLDVGQGDAILVETPKGRQVLVDGGPSPSAVLSQLGGRLPFWDRTLDMVVLTHPDDDHITGLVEVLDRYEVEIALFREVGCEEAICRRWDRLLDEKQIRRHQAEVGLDVELEDGVRLEVLHPGAELTAGEGFNNNSVVTRLTHGKISVLLTGDIETAAERALLERGDNLRSSVLKVAHHGACGSSSAGFLEAADPEVAVISVGADNDFRHPCDGVLARLTEVVGDANREPLVFRTDRDGSVEVVTDGTQLWINTERER
jgi:competence protein ComEC